MEANSAMPNAHLYLNAQSILKECSDNAAHRPKNNAYTHNTSTMTTTTTQHQSTTRLIFIEQGAVARPSGAERLAWKSAHVYVCVSRNRLPIV
jgi:hypothetical protein